ncbi:hypothetical protein H310_00873 [Aphanomyces invadans]|uniref:Uncharacterized protein n=1 Tax=Aphanomyces invadans TaxID=157072 RepID=A0A024URH6_9STRA|nr:hypothetical protein H310_00873 [Aphanomyces invadans]ETW08233.1 hypothetical protein H310_00873 [Aphanomyces invadans]|eukprot:XP_008862038.1 hypothetical protein H310_00873 [Aphanomyces invadans]
MHPDCANPLHTDLRDSVYLSTRSLPRDSSMHRSLPRANSARASLSSNAGPGLANYSKLSFSMSYKNRQSTVYVDDPHNAARDNNSSFIGGGRESQLLDDKSRMTTMSAASAASTYCSSRDSSTSVMNQQQSSNIAPLPRPLEKQTSFASSPINTIQEDSDVSEVEIAAMQAKRALRRMCLSLVTLNKSGKDDELMDNDEDDDDEDDGDYEELNSAASCANSLTYPLRYSDENEDDHVLLPNFGRKAQNPKKKPRLDSDLITISRADLQQLQSRLQALEHKLADQATKQADLEAHIEREVGKRTKHVESEYEAKVEELTMARDFEVDQEIQRRLSEFSAASTQDKIRRSKAKPMRKALLRASTSMSDMFRGGGGSTTAPSDLDQFREFLQLNSKRMSDRLSRSTLFRDTFHGRDPSLMTSDFDVDTDDDNNHGEALVDTIQKLRAVVADQGNQLEQAKYLISVAAIKMTVTEDVVKDAWEEMGKMDMRLERQAQELADLRRYSTYSQGHNNSSSFASSTSLSVSSAPTLRASGRQTQRSS